MKTVYSLQKQFIVCSLQFVVKRMVEARSLGLNGFTQIKENPFHPVDPENLRSIHSRNKKAFSCVPFFPLGRRGRG